MHKQVHHSRRKQKHVRKDNKRLVQLGNWCLQHLLIPFLTSFVTQWLKGNIEHWMK